MNLKAILCDYDGTLVDTELKYNRGVKKLIAKIKSKNIRFSLCTGQPNYSLIGKTLSELSIEDYHIFHGGALIRHNKNKHVLWHQYIPEKSLTKVLNYFKENKLFYALETNDFTYYLDKIEQNYIEPQNVKFLTGLKSPNRVLKILLTSTVNKFTEKQINNHIEELGKICQDLAFSKFFWKYYGLDITSEKATKHTAVLEYEKLLNIPRNQIVAIGDDYNDYPMFTACGYKIAMENAPKELKEIADFIAPPIKKNGTIVALKHIISKFNL